MIKNIILDVGNVLILWDPMRMLLKKFDDMDTVYRAMTTVFKSPYWRELDRGVMDEGEILDTMFREGSLSREEFDKVLENWEEGCMRENPSMGRAVQMLRKKGKWKFYLLSNFADEPFDRAQERFDVLKGFDGQIISAREKTIKPEPEIYQRLFEKYDLKPEECIFLDDIERNVNQAKEMGMEGIHFQNNLRIYDLFDRLKADEE